MRGRGKWSSSICGAGGEGRGGGILKGKMDGAGEGRGR